MVLGTPVLAISLVLIALERIIGIGVSTYKGRRCTVIPARFFWFYSHPAVYIMILPGMGVISEVISTFSRKRVFGYTAVAFSSVAIAVFGFFVWEHHMFIMGVSDYSALIFSMLTMSTVDPSFRPSRFLIGPSPCTRDRLPSKRRCCMPLASWGYSPSAA